MFEVSQYTITRGEQSANMLGDCQFGTLEEAKALFDSIDLAEDYRTEYNCRAYKQGMRDVAFVKEIIQVEDGECISYEAFEEYNYADFEAASE